VSAADVDGKNANSMISVKRVDAIEPTGNGPSNAGSYCRVVIFWARYTHYFRASRDKAFSSSECVHTQRIPRAYQKRVR
jgi:hypothetical protein